LRSLMTNPAPAAVAVLTHEPECVVLSLASAPRTKKNHGSVIVRRGRKLHVPSAAWFSWMHAIRRANLQRLPRERLPQLAARPYNCAATFYRDRDIGDAVGYYQGLADLLQALLVVPDDKWLVAWDGSRLTLDRQCPRVIVRLTPLP